MKRYNISRAAKELKVVRQTLYNWIEKGWIKPKRDYRNYPIFTAEDVEKIKKWRDKLNKG